MTDTALAEENARLKARLAETEAALADAVVVDIFHAICGGEGRAARAWLDCRQSAAHRRADPALAEQHPHILGHAALPSRTVSGGLPVIADQRASATST